MYFRSLSGSLLAVLFAISGNAQFEIRGSRLYLNGNLFTVRGVAYSPTPIGETAGPDLRVSACVYSRDFPLLAMAGANTVRLYARLPAGDRAFWQAVEKNNLYVLAGFPLEPYHDPQATLASGPLRAKILVDLRRYAEELRGRKSVVALIFGNEVADGYGRKFSGSTRDFYGLLNEAAGVLREVLGAAAPLVSTAVADPAEIGPENESPGLAFWSVNVFRGFGFGDLFEDLRRRTQRPVLLSEFGVDAYDSFRQVEDPVSHAAGLRSLMRLLENELRRPGSVVAGGVWFGFSDEWWRGGPDTLVHGASGTPRAGFPDGVANWGWFGLFGVVATDAPRLDSLRPRPAFTALAEEWGGRSPAEWASQSVARLRPQGVVNAGSLVPAVAPGGLVSFFGEQLAAGASAAAASPLPLQMELTSACLGSHPVALLYADADQINGQAAWEAPLGLTQALVYRAGGASNVAWLEVREQAPGILDRGVIPAGRPCPVSVANGVRPGTYLEVYGTGLGDAPPGLVSGVALTAAREISRWPRAFLGTRELRVLYAGLAPGMAGLYQVNTQVPEDFPPGQAALRLATGAIDSNAYPLAVLGEAARPGFRLGQEPLSFVLQAGGSPQSVALPIEGQNGFCELVRFSVVGLADGVSVSVPVGFPGQQVPVTVQAAAHARGIQDAPATVVGYSLVEENPTARLRISVLPSRGDIPFRVVSGGGRAGLLARFEMAGRLLHEARGGGAGRGFNFLVLNGETGLLGPVRQFDTWLSERAGDDMADYLNGLSVGTVVLGAIADEGTLRLTVRARSALRLVLRSVLADELRYQSSWAIISRVGNATPLAEESATDRQVVLERVLTFPMP